MNSAQVVEMSVSVFINSPSQDCTHRDDHTSLTYDMLNLKQLANTGHKKSSVKDK